MTGICLKGNLRERNMAMKGTMKGKLRRMESKVANLIEKEAITVKYKILSNDYSYLAIIIIG